MRIAMVGPYPADPERPRGGVETSFVNLVSGLVELGGVDLHVLTFTPGEPDGNGSGMPFSLSRLPARARFNNLELYRTMRRVLDGALATISPDVVHAQDALGHGFVALKAGGQAPVIVSIHGIVRETRKAVRGLAARAQVSLAGVAVERYCVRHARYLLQPTRYPERYFGAEIRGHIVEVANGVSERFFAAQPAPVPGRILVAGALTEGKRALDVVEALANARQDGADATLRLAGSTADTAYVARLTARARELDVADSVALLGDLSTEEILEEYRSASLLVLASAQETSPMVIAEAMAAGVPVVATRVGGVPELVADGTTGCLYDPGDVPTLARTVTRLLGHEAERRRLRDAARRDAARFRPIEVASRVRDVYAEACRA